jgi:HK97 family phage prohead protease
MEADFSGYATKSGIKCSDGRTVTAEAFKHQNAMTVPLVWQHGHNKPDNVLGHGILEARPDGMYVQGFFNDTPQGKTARELVQHKDINALSIYANSLVEKAKTVLHGTIREVSLVLAGANPGALIDFVRVAHADGTIEDTDDEAVIYMDQPLVHGDGSQKTEVEEGYEDDVEPEEALAHAAQTVQDVVDGWSEEDKNVVAYLIGAALEQAKADVAHSDDIDNEGDLEHQEGKNDMTRNVFEQKSDGGKELRHSVSTDDMHGIVQDAAKLGSLRDAVESYAIRHGIDDIDVLFPDAQTLEQMPQFNKRRTEWVQGVLNGTHHSPFSRVKTVWADLTQEEARAKGYITGSYKIEEWFNVMKRVTTPTTIYKKQKLDRDDIVDITDFDVIAWIKQEMRMMLEEELARAILIGDGRPVNDADKIKDPMAAPAGDGIRAIINDHELFVTTMNVNVTSVTSYDVVVDEVMDTMEYYKGTGTPTLYTTIKQLNRFLKAKDGMGRRLYADKAQVASALGVADIVTVDVMNDEANLIGIIVNLTDYNIGADKGGEVSLFDDFDIDYNQQKYLIETRLSGALTKIKSAIVIKSTGASDQLLADPTEPTYNRTTGVVTIPTMANVVYKNADTTATLSSGAQTALTAGQTLNVQAVPASGYFFANDANTLWPFFRRTA